MTGQTEKNLAWRFAASILMILLLTAALSVTTFVLVLSTISTDGHLFGTGSVRLNLNDGKPVITEEDCILQPGSVYEKEFTVENLSTCDVWVKFYFTNVSGSLAQAITVEIADGDTVLARGKLSEMTEENTAACPESLTLGDRKTLTIRFRFAENAGNELQGVLLRFDFNAKAVQTKNNPEKTFD